MEMRLGSEKFLLFPQSDILVCTERKTKEKTQVLSFCISRGKEMDSHSLPEPFALSSPRPVTELDVAATKLQKVYKCYRTGRNLADCAVVVEELWWKALDSIALNQSSISLFNINKHESAVSRWARAKTRASKVGKGLLKDEKTQKLALQHWLEA